MSDAADLLQLRTAPTTQPSIAHRGVKPFGGSGSSAHHETNKKRSKKALEARRLAIDDTPPPLVPTQKLAFKEKRQKQGVKWTWTTFTSSARVDNLKLKHWQKNNVEWQDYPFAKFNRKVEVLRFNDAEYEQLLHVATWTKEETSQLLDLCERFDLRFSVIADRFKTPRTVEDCKDRFYAIQRQLYMSKGIVKDVTPDNVLFSRPYDRDYEIARKAHLERCFARPRREEQEERELLEEAKELHALIKKKEREMRLASHKKSSAPGSMAVDALGGGGRPVKGSEDKIDVSELESGGVVLRSNLLDKESIPEDTRIQEIVKELKLDNLLPTSAVHAASRELRAHIFHLIQWQQLLARKKYEYDKLRVFKAQVLKPPPARKRASTGGASGATEGGPAKKQKKSSGGGGGSKSSTSNASAPNAGNKKGDDSNKAGQNTAGSVKSAGNKGTGNKAGGNKNAAASDKNAKSKSKSDKKGSSTSSTTSQASGASATKDASSTGSSSNKPSKSKKAKANNKSSANSSGSGGNNKGASQNSSQSKGAPGGGAGSANGTPSFGPTNPF